MPGITVAIKQLDHPFHHARAGRRGAVAHDAFGGRIETVDAAVELAGHQIHGQLLHQRHTRRRRPAPTISRIGTTAMNR